MVKYDNKDRTGHNSLQVSQLHWSVLNLKKEKNPHHLKSLSFIAYSFPRSFFLSPPPNQVNILLFPDPKMQREGFLMDTQASPAIC